MKTTVNVYEFRDAFRRYGRNDQFSYEALTALFEHLEEYEESTGEELELDVVSLCCDFSEHASALECIKDNGYGFEPDPDADEDDQESEALEYLQENTTVITFDTGIIIQGF